MECGTWSINPGDGYYGVMWWGRSNMAWVKYAELVTNLIIGRNPTEGMVRNAYYFIYYIMGLYPLKPLEFDLASNDRIRFFTLEV